MKTVVVVNPTSAGGRTGRQWGRWRDIFERHLGSFELAITGQPGNATHITREALRAGADRIISVGGDGTNHEVVGGFFDPATRQPIRPDARFAFIPCGTGADLARTLAVPKGIDAQLLNIVASPGRTIDLMGCTFQTANGPAWQPCVNMASVGQGGDLVQRVGQWKRFMSGGLPFILAGIQGAVFVKPWLVQLRVDDGEPMPTLLRNLTICNGRFNGGGMEPAPQARIDDGALELVGMGKASALRSIAIGLSSYKAKMQEAPEVWHRTIRTVDIEPMPGQPPMLLELDGEQPGFASARFEVLPRALCVCV